MEKEQKERIEKILDAEVRPKLQLHGGDLDVVDVKDDILYVRLKGQCSGCPSSKYTVESLVKEEIMAKETVIKDVVLHEEMDPELLDFARSILQRGKKKEENE